MRTTRLQMPVLAMGGAESLGERAAAIMKAADDDDVQGVVLPAVIGDTGSRAALSSSGTAGVSDLLRFARRPGRRVLRTAQRVD